TASTVVSGSSDRTARLWDAAAGHCLAIFEGHSDSVTCLAAFEDQLATGSDDTTIKVWPLKKRVRTGFRV
ncbi:lin-23, partial [Symbiodinium sp. KB8]